jgi:hypothetical protein
MQSPGVSGLFAVHAALEALLDGTALVPARSANGVITVDVRGMTESLEVTGRLPRQLQRRRGLRHAGEQARHRRPQPAPRSG